MTGDRQQLPSCCRCEKCGFTTVGSNPLCPRCGHGRMTRIETTPEGKILDFVPVIYPPENLKELGNYTSVLVKLENGCNVFGIMLEDSGRLEAGQGVIVSKYDPDRRELFFEGRPTGKVS